jgi:aspartyl-tRNA(Asn)/glutamyl-tRNA(Gln) amidotransferase subunit B
MPDVSPQTLAEYELVVGLEVHCQLLTESKIFAPDAAVFGGEPNTDISPITLAHPGTLPRLNQRAVELAVRMGLALGCEISRLNVFDRKNYFYPDLPKGFQTTQDKTPICLGGQLEVAWRDQASKQSGRALVSLNRIHLEEDAGKSIHPDLAAHTLLDLNRAGTALIEIVTEPCLRRAEEAGAFLAEIRRLVRYLGVCDGNLEQGSMRCDANVSVRPRGQTALGRKVEVKNMNSVRNVQRAIEHEFTRQVALVAAGGQVVSETRLFNADNGQTYAMRTKEELNDYRYFPEPDLAPVRITDEFLAAIRAALPALPQALQAKFTGQYGLPAYDAEVLTDEKSTADYFQAVADGWPAGATARYKAASNWLMGPIKAYLNETGTELADFPVGPARLREVVDLQEAGQLNFGQAAKQLLPALVAQPQRPAADLAQQLGLLLTAGNDDALLPLVQAVLAKFPAEVAAYRKGKKNLQGLFMGEVMKAAQGKADPKKLGELLRQALETV